MHRSDNSNQKISDSTEFLPAALEVLEHPPSPIGRVIVFVLCAFFLLAVIWSWWGTVDIVVVAEGQTIPAGKVKNIQPLETGVVRAIHVKDGQKVVAGDLLLELDPTETSANLESLQFELAQSRAEAAIGLAMLSDEPLEVLVLPEELSSELAENSHTLLQDSLDQLRSSLKAIKSDIERNKATLRATDIEEIKLEQTLPLIRERLEAQQGLLAKGITQKPLVMQLQQELYEMLALRDGLEETRAQASASIASLQARHVETIASYRTAAAERRQAALNKIAALEQSLRKETQRQKYRKLRAPVSGYVDKLSVNTIGAVVETGNLLLSIVPSEVPLEIEAIILNKDIGFIEVGQNAEIKLEAFPFTRYGVLQGKVSRISNDVLLHEQLGPIYKARVALKSQHITVAGKNIPLVPGMTASAEVKTGKRRIIEFFLSPLLRYKDEAIRER
ncbi:HlyD family type I secretion periplasmic adaptor subunit [Pseudovibrio sp. Ad37]|uniref:HlyD family type I secretion periplasmic adaptor subunit n=1 Tax=Pseudovibrio sp. Ad37 TaxID=989422 RepID=UPI0007AE3CFB|nr:HlyD family type I secretion periplasmic adaptor subunit [Pseudovibrio sp. Ad37]KZL23843.1 Hemolysin secretion protein D, plasmid [Pseudovibrio sp. Ad37]